LVELWEPDIQLRSFCILLGVVVLELEGLVLAAVVLAQEMFQLAVLDAPLLHAPNVPQEPSR
jgi:hypothetical protein